MIRVHTPEGMDPLIQPPLIIEEVTDPEEIARAQARFAQGRRNSDWLQSHWSELLPQALGKFLAVAGQEAFLADTPQEAIANARAAHPDDKGLLIQYVRPEKGPRIYGSQGRVASR